MRVVRGCCRVLSGFRVRTWMLRGSSCCTGMKPLCGPVLLVRRFLVYCLCLVVVCWPRACVAVLEDDVVVILELSVDTPRGLRVWVWLGRAPPRTIAPSPRLLSGLLHCLMCCFNQCSAYNIDPCFNPCLVSLFSFYVCNKYQVTNSNYKNLDSFFFKRLGKLQHANLDGMLMTNV